MIYHAYAKLGVPRTTYQRLAFYSSVSYNLGGDIYSFDDLEHGVLRCNHRPLLAFRPPFYKNFRLNKLFNLWRKNVNFRMYATKRLRLQSKLFLSKTAFCEHSLTIHGMLHKMTSAPFIATKFNSGDLKRLSKIQIFLDHQDNIRKESREAMNVIVEEIHTLIEKTCKHVVDVSAKAAEEVEKEARGYFAEDAKTEMFRY